MKYPRRFGALYIVLIALAPSPIPAGRCFGAVDLGFRIGGAVPTTVNVTPGSFFTFSVVAHSSSNATTDQMGSVDYHFTSTASGVTFPFSIASRVEPAGDSFPAVYASDVSVAGQTINPMNQSDLGGSTSMTSNLFISNSTFEVADYSIKVSPTAPLTSYVFSFAAYPLSSYGEPDFSDNPFSTVGSINLNVVAPEPQSCAVAGLGLLCLRRKRRSA